MGAVLSKYQVGPAVVTEALYEPLPSLTTVNSSEVPYISLDEFLADESLEDKQHQTDNVWQLGSFYYYCYYFCYFNCEI